MRKLRWPLVAVSLLAGSVPGALGQQVAVNRENRTIAVTVKDTARADAEIAVITAGYQNYGRTEQAAYEENTRVTNKVIQALLAVGIPKEDIETQSVSLQRQQYFEQDSTPAERQERQFSAEQSVKIRVAASHAQDTVDVAVAAGANEVQDVEWTVADVKALETKAADIALAKARSLADQLAHPLGGKVGQLLFASNEIPPQAAPVFGGVLGRMAAGAAAKHSLAPPPEPMLKLFPKKVEEEATVYAVFALE